jgi:hypothetical protein
MPISSGVLRGAIFGLLLSACGSEDSAHTPRVADGSRLSAAARAELEQLDVERYRGKARITGEVAEGDVVRVTFDPASGPICLRGAEFAAFYVDRKSENTMILLAGGGACWSGLCAASATASAMPPANGLVASDYFKDWNLVYVSYCDGSVFAGDNQVTEPDGTIRYHHGRQNLAAALDLAATHFGASKRVLVGGFSAGGYGTLRGMISVRLLYPEADLFVLNDSGPGVQNPAQADAIAKRLEEWRFDKTVPPSCTECDQGRGQMTAMFSWMLKNDSTIHISLLSYYEDQVIGTAFNSLDGPAYKALLTSESGKVQASYPDRFKRYMLPGTAHVVTTGWNTVTADGVKVSDWVIAMVQGDNTVWKDLLASGP